jgi:hypothetical protein
MVNNWIREPESKTREADTGDSIGDSTSEVSSVIFIDLRMTLNRTASPNGSILNQVPGFRRFAMSKDDVIEFTGSAKDV